MLKFFTLIFMLSLQPVFADDQLSDYRQEANQVGTARLSVMFWDVYDATLYAPEDTYHPQKSFALQLNYLMDFSGKDIAERSVEEMRKQGFDDEMKLAAWYSQMRDLFPDVEEGTSLTGIYQPQKPTAFYVGDTRLGEIKDPQFGKYFFDIWLSQKTSEPEIRRNLLSL